MKPHPEGLVDVIETDARLDTGKEPIPDGSKQSFYFSPGGAVIGFGMDQRDAGHGTASGQYLRGEACAVVDVKSFRDAIGHEGLFDYNGQRTDGLRGVEAISHHHSTVIIDDGAQNGIYRAVVDHHLGAVHKIAMTSSCMKKITIWGDI